MVLAGVPWWLPSGIGTTQIQNQYGTSLLSHDACSHARVWLSCGQKILRGAARVAGVECACQARSLGVAGRRPVSPCAAAVLLGRAP
jgi:hypothetical protein